MKVFTYGQGQNDLIHFSFAQFRNAHRFIIIGKKEITVFFFLNNMLHHTIILMYNSTTCTMLDRPPLTLIIIRSVTLKRHILFVIVFTTTFRELSCNDLPKGNSKYCVGLDRGQRMRDKGLL